MRLEESIQRRAKANQVAAGATYGERHPNQALPQISAQPVTPVKTREVVAKVAQVSHDTVAKVKKIEAIAPPEIKQALSAGTMSINQAH